MPYVKQDVRDELQYPLDVINGHITDMLCSKPEDRAGILNYVITVLIDNAYGPLSGAKYRDYNEAIGMLECCKLEFYRKAAAPYEDLKEKENGSVLDGETRKPPKPALVKNTPTEMMMAKPTDGYDRIIDPALEQEKELFLKEMLCNNPLSPSTFFSDGGKTRKIISEHLSSIFNPELSQSITDCGKLELEQNRIHIGSNMSTSVFGSHKIIGNCSNSLEASHATKLMVSMKERIESGLGKYMEENPEIGLTGEFTVVYTVKDDKIKES